LELVAEATSRYENDFEEIQCIGQGGFGSVFKARHKVDGNIYAIKKIKLQSTKNSEENKRIRREVNFFGTLTNQYIVRYFQTWVELETDPDKIRELGGDSDEDYGSCSENSDDDAGEQSPRNLERKSAKSISK
jgi:serine/threonine protein kinase